MKQVAYSYRGIVLHSGLTSLQDALQLSDYVAQTSSALAFALHEAIEIRQVQHDALLASGELVKTIADLADKTRAEFGIINGSAYQIKQHLQIREDGEREQWKVWLIRVLKLIYGGNS